VSGGGRDDDDGHEEAARESFANMAGEDGEIDAYELKNILDSVFQQGTEAELVYTDTDGCKSHDTGR